MATIIQIYCCFMKPLMSLILYEWRLVLSTVQQLQLTRLEITLDRCGLERKLRKDSCEADLIPSNVRSRNSFSRMHLAEHFA